MFRNYSHNINKKNHFCVSKLSMAGPSKHFWYHFKPAPKKAEQTNMLELRIPKNNHWTVLARKK